MTFTETFASVDNDFSALEMVLEKCDIFMEASYNEYEKNLKELELKIIKENGNDDDRYYLESEAKEGLIVRIGKAIQKMIDSVIKFINSIFQKISGKVGDIEVKNAIKKAEAFASTNASVKEKKIKVENPNAKLSLINKTNAELDKTIAKLKSNPDSVSHEEIKEIKEGYDKKKVAIAAAVSVVSVASAIALYKGITSKASSSDKDKDVESLNSLKKYVDGISKKSMSTAQKAKKDMDTDYSAGSDTMNKLYAAIAAKSTLIKDKWKVTSNSINSTFSEISSSLTSTKLPKGATAAQRAQVNAKNAEKAVSKVLKTKTESVEDVDVDSLLNEIIESVENDPGDPEDSDFGTSLGGENKIATESEDFDAENYLNTIESEIDDITSKVTESDNDSEDLQEYANNVIDDLLASI